MIKILGGLNDDAIFVTKQDNKEQQEKATDTSHKKCLWIGHTFVIFFIVTILIPIIISLLLVL